MFVEKLTKEQLCDFFKTKHLSHFMSSSVYGEDYLYVSVDGDSMSVNYRLYDFEGSTVENESKWRNFLYSIFGEEYKAAYTEYLQEMMKEKLLGLIKIPEYEIESEEIER